MVVVRDVEGQEAEREFAALTAKTGEPAPAASGRPAPQLSPDPGSPAFETAISNALESPAAVPWPRRATPPQGPATRPPASVEAPSGPSVASGTADWDADVYRRVEERLAAEIGPLARILVRKESKRQGTWGALVEALTTQVPEEAGRRRLREALGPLGV